jgi:predicted O-methyltransferase YrrM
MVHIEQNPNLDSIEALAADWHGGGTLSNPALRYLDAVLAELRDPVTVETGAGRSTIVFSWRSRAHTVFALDVGESVSKPLGSPLLGPAPISVVNGPTQETLFRHVFDEPLDLVLLDGPHGFPFPALEYFRLYPHIRTGGVLVIDDVQIRSIGDMYRFLRADAMWSLKRRVGNTAFFVRTAAPAIDPHSDSWWLQGYNQQGHGRMLLRRLAPGWLIRLRRRWIARFG